MNYYPPSEANNALTEFPTDSEHVLIDEQLFTRFFNSLGALQNAWIVVVSNILKAPCTSRFDTDIFETVASLGRSIVEILKSLPS
jgi:hypothetical protein